MHKEKRFTLLTVLEVERALHHSGEGLLAMSWHGGWHRSESRFGGHRRSVPGLTCHRTCSLGD